MQYDNPSPRHDRYRSYLLRCWQIQGSDQPEWRISLEQTHTHQRWNFACLDDLLAFLRADLGNADTRVARDDAIPEDDGF